VQQPCDQHAAETFLRRVIAATGSVITDKLLSYLPALRRVLRNVDHRGHKGLNTRAENSRQPTRRVGRSCVVSSRPSRHNASWDRSARSATISELDAIGHPVPLDANCWWNDAPPGKRSLDSTWPEIDRVQPSQPADPHAYGDTSSP
jgi:hypothetical protein